MTTIVNLTQHAPTPEQIEAGVGPQIPDLRELLDFKSIPTRREINERARAIAEIAAATGMKKAMIGGAPFLMAVLAEKLFDRNIEALYAFSERVSVEEQQPDGTVKKTNVFKHVGFVPHESAWLV